MKRNLYVSILIIACLILTIIGVLMSFSISSAVIEGFSLELFYRQLLYVGIAALAFIFFSSFNHLKLKRNAKVLFLIFIALLVLLLVKEFDNSHRWLPVPLIPFGFQPSQYAYIILSLLIARLSLEPIEDRNVNKFFIFMFLIVVITSALIIFEPDMGSGAQVFITGFALIFILGMPIGHVFALSAFSILGVISMFGLNSEWRNRILAFRDPYKYATADAMQSLQALRALARGGFAGVGFMKSLLKFPGRLPVSSSDFVYAIIGEEFGLIGCTLILFFNILIAYVGFRVAREAKSTFSRILAFGLTFGIISWSLLNMAVNVMLIPTTGVPLSFVSFGGNNLIANFISAGILVNIARKEIEE